MMIAQKCHYYLKFYQEKCEEFFTQPTLNGKCGMVLQSMRINQDYLTLFLKLDRIRVMLSSHFPHAYKYHSSFSCQFVSHFFAPPRQVLFPTLKFNMTKTYTHQRFSKISITDCTFNWFYLLIKSTNWVRFVSQGTKLSAKTGFVAAVRSKSGLCILLFED